MKRLLGLLILFCSLSINLYAQPANDNCSGAIVLTNLDDWCSAEGAYTNVAATASISSLPSCWTGSVPSNDVWFKFTATASAVNIKVDGSTSPSTLNKPQIVLFENGESCTITSMSQIGCTQFPTANTYYASLYKSGLTIGKEYLILVDAYNTNTGKFKLCINNFNPPVAAGQDCSTASLLCNKNTFTQQTLAGSGNSDEIAAAPANCLTAEHNSAWYKWTAKDAGTVTFSLDPLIPDDDIDWVLYDVTNGCASKTTVSCNGASCSGPTGLNTTQTKTSEPGGCDGDTDETFNKQLTQVAGKSYLLVVDNFTDASVGMNNGFTISFGGTGNFVGPESSFTISPSAPYCTGDNITFTSTAIGSPTTYSWDFGSGASIATANTAGPHTVTYSTAGTKTIVLTVGNGICTDISYQTISVGTAPTMTYNISDVDPTCGASNGSITIAPVTPTNMTYNWVSGPVVSPIPAGNKPGGATDERALTNLPAGTYCVDITAPAVPGGTTTTTLFTEDFEAATPPWTIDNSNGANIFVINNAYVGGTCVSGAGNFTVPDVPNQSAAITGNVQSKYLHIKATTTTGATCTAASTNFIPNNANFDAQTSDQKVTMNSSINTTGYTNVVISFYWLARGDASGNDYGAIEYSTNGGSTWTQAGAKLYNSYANWTTSTRTDPTWSNQANLKFRVRWINNASSTPDPPIAIDHIVVTGDQVTPATCQKTVQECISIAPSSSPAITPGTPVQVCEGVTSTTFTYTSTGSPDKYSIDWNAAATTAGFVDVVDATLTASPQTIALAAGLTAGTYTGSLSVKNSSTGCTSAGQNISVTVITCCTPPTPSAGNDVTISCSTNSSGATIGAASVAGVTYSWSPTTGLSAANVSNPTANPTATTTYTLTAHTTSTDCSASDQIVVTVDKAAPAATAGTDATISCSQNASGVTLGAASVAGVTYAWTPPTGLSGATLANPLATPTSTTSYTLTTTKTSNGCTASDGINITVSGSVPSANAGTSGTISCAANSSGLSIGAAAVAGNTYSWTPTTGLSSATVSDPTANPTVTTVYTLTATNTTSGCTASNSVTVTVDKTVPVANAGTDGTISCTQNSSGYTIGVASVSGVTYLWSPTTNLSSATLSNPLATPTATNTYTLTSTQTSSGCTASDDVIVTVAGGMPTSDAGLDGIISCTQNSSGYTIGKASVAGESYLWNPSTGLSANNISNPLATPTVTTTYTVVTTNTSSGCTSNDQVVVTVSGSVPISVAGADATISCAQNTSGYALGKASVAGETYAWTPTNDLSSSSVSNPTASPTVTTTYTVVTTNSSTGCTTSDEVIVTVDLAAPTASAGTDAPICAGASTQLSGSGGVSGSWSPNTGLVNANNYNTNATPSSTTTYILTVIGSNGCTDTDDVTITVNPIPPANAGSDVSICEGTTTTLNASGGTSYVWSTSPDLSSTSINNPVASPTVTSTYTVTVSDNGCNASDEVVVSVVPIPLPTITATPPAICKGQSSTLTASSSVAYSGGTTYLWNTTSPTALIYANPTTTTTYSVIASNATCTNSAEVVLTVNQLPTPTFDADTLFGCAPFTVNFTNTTANTGSVLWNFYDYINSNATSTNPNPTYVYAGQGVFDVKLTVTDLNGCTSSVTIPEMIKVNALPTAGFSHHPEVATIEEPDINFVSSTTSSNVDEYSWHIYDIYSAENFSQDANTSHRFIEPGSYLVTLIVRTEFGCTDSTSKTVIMKPENMFYIPNIFTPNDDDINDDFGPVMHNIDESDFEFLIFNRWGDLIFSTNDINVRWDGKFEGALCPLGVYSWVIHYRELGGVRISKKGMVVVGR